MKKIEMIVSKTYEVNFDGIVGPTHNFSGLSFGNVASLSHKAGISNPKEAALQGLAKAKALMDLGLYQAVLPPQERPNIEVLRRLGFTGTDEKVMADAFSKNPEVYRSVCSASSMWTANAVTLAPSADTSDHKVHFTPANLNNKFHRSFEHITTSRVLRSIFSDPNHFVHHPALPEGPWFGDEGSANHTRLCREHSGKGVHFFVFGRFAFQTVSEPKRFPARQTFEASQAVARLHGLSADQVVFAQQNPDFIDAGVFHNDVGAVGNEGLYLFHERSYVNQEMIVEELKTKFAKVTGGQLNPICVPEKTVSVQDAIKSYLFNSQVVTLSSNEMVFVAPKESEECAAVRNYLEVLKNDSSNPITQVRFLDVRQSMSNGGGLACLRLRVVLNEEEIKKVNPQIFLSEKRYSELCGWVKKHYRDKLAPDDLADPNLLKEGRVALDELTQILSLGSIYSFQK